MNRFEHPLRRLFKAAARARREVPTQVPRALQTRVLAAWRGGDDEHASGDERLLLVPLLRRALAWACLVALIALALGLSGSDPVSSDGAVLINSPVTVNELP
jgi:hypothetical protein